MNRCIRRGGAVVLARFFAHFDFCLVAKSSRGTVLTRVFAIYEFYLAEKTSAPPRFD